VDSSAEALALARENTKLNNLRQIAPSG